MGDWKNKYTDKKTAEVIRRADYEGFLRGLRSAKWEDDRPRTPEQIWWVPLVDAAIRGLTILAVTLVTAVFVIHIYGDIKPWVAAQFYALHQSAQNTQQLTTQITATQQLWLAGLLALIALSPVFVKWAEALKRLAIAVFFLTVSGAIVFLVYALPGNVAFHRVTQLWSVVRVYLHI